MKITPDASKRPPHGAPEVTVLMAVYNGARFLREAIESILAQTWLSFEFLIVNDGSTDDTREIILSYDDPRIRLVDNRRNLGLARSLNRGLQLATGDLVARQDADDIAEPQRLNRQVAFMRQNPEVAIVGSWCREIDAEGRFLRRGRLPTDAVAIRWKLLFICPFYHSAVMLRRSAVGPKVGFYNEDLSYAMDLELWQRIARCLPVANLAEFLVRYRVHGESMTATFGDRTREGYRLHLAAVSDLLGWSALERERNERRFNQMFSLLQGKLGDLEPNEAAAAAVELMRLHDVCRRSRALGEGDWEAHGHRLRFVLRARLLGVAGWHLIRRFSRGR